MKTIDWFWLKPLVWFWNPSPRRIKVRSRKGGYVLDIRGRMRDRRIREAELLRRVENGEELVKIHKIGLVGSIEMEGRSK